MEPAGKASEKFNLRLPDGMRDQIRTATARSGRSMNSEIVARLRATFDMDDPDLVGTMERLISAVQSLEKKLDKI